MTAGAPASLLRLQQASPSPGAKRGRKRQPAKVETGKALRQPKAKRPKCGLGRLTVLSRESNSKHTRRWIEHQPSRKPPLGALRSARTLRPREMMRRKYAPRSLLIVPRKHWSRSNGDSRWKKVGISDPPIRRRAPAPCRPQESKTPPQPGQSHQALRAVPGQRLLRRLAPARIAREVSVGCCSSGRVSAVDLSNTVCAPFLVLRAAASIHIAGHCRPQSSEPLK
jgi:hypothetical protein